MSQYSIKVYKQYFNFSAAHFLVFPDGTREPLHGHNYRVQVRGEALELSSDMVFDFLDIKPLVREVCDSLDHKILLPQENPNLRFECGEHSVKTVFGAEVFQFPRSDVLFLPLPNTSAERLAIFLGHQLVDLVWKRFQFQFKALEIEVEETPGQSAVHVINL